MTTDWRDHIHSDPGIGFGKPIFRGTRLKVEFVLKLMAAGWTADRMAEEWPEIEPIHLQAAAGFAADLIENESYVAVGQARAA